MLATLAALFVAVPLPPGAAAIPLPKDPKAVVIEFSFRRGSTPPRKSNLPNLTVTVGGVVTANDPLTDTTASFQLPQKELQGLMHLIVVQKRFLDISEETIAKDMLDEQKRRGLIIGPMADPVTTVIKVRTADKEHEVKVSALDTHADIYEKIESLQNLVAIEKTLIQLLSTALAGGPTAIDASLKVANDAIKETFPALKSLVADDLRFARIQPGGVVSLNFYRWTEPEKDMLEVSLSKPADAFKINSMSRSLTPSQYADHVKDDKAFTKLLDAVNAEVKKKVPELANLTAADLRSMRWRDGQVEAFLGKRGAVFRSFVEVNVLVPASGAPMITVNGRPF